MYFVQGRPRFWIPGYDTGHLVVPALLLLVGVLLAFLPARPVSRARVMPPPPARPAVPTTILAPAAGSVLAPGQLSVVEGLAQPGGLVRLYWFDKPLGEPTRIGADGRWSFNVGNFPPGQHILRALALVEGRYVRSPEVVFVVEAPAPKSVAKPTPKTGKKSVAPSKAPTKPRKPATTRP